MDPIYLFLHIPRTGGTTLIHSIGHYLDRTNDRYLKHYHFVQNFSEPEYGKAHIPQLMYRTTEQQRKLRIMTGHSIFCNSHRWLRVRKEPRIFAYTRHPIYRVLSSFNYRNRISTLEQCDAAFSFMNPWMNENARHQRKTAKDYETLYEYYLDNNYEQNIQCKWIVKAFANRENYTWTRHPAYMFGPDSGIPVDQAVPLSWPDWMYDPLEENVDWYQMAEEFFPEIWWLSRLEMINEHLQPLCEFMGVEYIPTEDMNRSGDDLVSKYWTIEEVMNQPDIDKLIEAESADFKLYEAAKNWNRPF